jgi:hypothetical protein
MVVLGRIVRFHPASMAAGAWTRLDRHAAAHRQAMLSESNEMGAMQIHIRHLAPIAIALAVATLPVAATTINVNQDTFVLSNEGPGFLIDQLVNAGYGNENLYQALVQITTGANPSVSSVLTPAFLNSLATCPASSEIFTTQLKDVTSHGVSVSISTDGTVRYDGITGRLYYNEGAPTLTSNISGVGRLAFHLRTRWPPGPGTSCTATAPRRSLTTVSPYCLHPAGATSAGTGRQMWRMCRPSSMKLWRGIGH